MINLRATEVAEIVNGRLIGQDCTITEQPVINSAHAKVGSLFLAFNGQSHDGHDFVADAFSHGAVMALVSREVSEPCIVVDDVTIALGKLAHYVRSQLSQLTVIGITGSQGKTTTKELLNHLLSSHAPTVAPVGNYNNEIGLPLSILQCTESTKYCIVEMGARHLGDISHLAAIAQPQIGVVLRVGAAHISEFGSIEVIAQAKSELIQSLGSAGTAILGRYDEFTPQMANLHSGKTLFFGATPQCQIRATDIELREGRPHFDLITPDGRTAVALRIVGEHHVANALAVAAVATVLGFTLDQISSSLSTAQSHARWRMEVQEFPGLLLINDSYNASPDSTSAALRTLIHFAQERGGESWAFLGKMQELGESSDQEHSLIGTLASEIGIDHLICIAAPEYARSIVSASETTIHLCADKSAALEVARNINPGDVVLVKASRSEKFEELVQALSEQWQAREGMQE